MYNLESLLVLHFHITVIVFIFYSNVIRFLTVMYGLVVT